jgi:hypothetical protein
MNAGGDAIECAEFCLSEVIVYHNHVVYNVITKRLTGCLIM